MHPWKTSLLLSFLSFLAVVLVGGCGQKLPNFEPTWQPADLRELRYHAREDANHQLVAAYARLTDHDLEVRVDFLGSPDPFDYDLYLLIDDRPGGGGRLPVSAPADSVSILNALAWDIALGFPAQGLPRAFGPDETPLDIRPRIIRLSVQDAAVVRIQRSLLRDPQQARFAVLVARAGKAQALDSIGPLAVNGPAAGKKANLLLAFWDSLPAATPAQALRRWDGAHTGPYGERHGLGELLQASSRAAIPIVMLDLKRGDRLAALDALNQMDRVRNLQQDGLLVLPDLVYGDPRAASLSLGETTRASQAYRVKSSRLLYGAFEGTPPGSHAAAFFRPPERAGLAQHLLEQEGVRWIPLPAVLPEDVEQADPEGLTVTVRRALLELALAPDAGGMVVLGGSLPESPWGDSTVADPAFRYIAGHPWLNVLDEDDLLHIPAQPGTPACPDRLCLPPRDPSATARLDTVRAAVTVAPPGVFGTLARRTFLALSDLSADPAESALRAGYLGDVGYLLAAASWETSKGASASSQARISSNCSDDLDWDGKAECVLASRNMFLALSPADGRLVLAAGRSPSGTFQVIGPRSQLAVGLSDPLDWKPGNGIYADPQELAGAFGDRAGVGEARYQLEAGPDELIFTRADGNLRKRYRLTADSIEVTIESKDPTLQDLPLILLDQQADRLGAYRRYTSSQPSPDTLTWSILDGPAVSIRVRGADLQSQTFTESLNQLKQGEDPNTSYPPGHYLPFPMALISLSSQDTFSVEIRFGQ